MALLFRELIRGDSRKIRIAVVDTNRQPVDLTGATVFFTLSSYTNPPNDNDAAIAKTVNAFADPASGVVDIDLASADTDSLTPGTYYFDVQVVDTFGNVISRSQDTINVSADITRRTS